MKKENWEGQKVNEEERLHLKVKKEGKKKGVLKSAGGTEKKRGSENK